MSITTKCVFFVVVGFALFGFVLPWLISDASDIAVIGGLAVMVLLALWMLRCIEKRITKGKLK